MERLASFISGISVGLAAGILLFMFLYGLYLYGLTKDLSYLFYAFYGAFSCSQILAFPLQTVWPGYESATNFGPALLHLDFLRHLAFSFFIARFLALSTSSPRHWRSFVGVLIGYTGLSLYINIHQIRHGYFDLFGLSSDSFYSHMLPSFYMFVPEFHTVLLLCILLVLVWNSHNALKMYLVGMVILALICVLIPLMYSFVVDNGDHYYAWVRPLTPYEKIKGHYSHEMADGITYAVYHLGIVLQGFCISLALAYRSRLIERDNTTIRATYTEQLEMELTERTRELRAQERLLEAERFRQLEQVFDQKQAETEMAALRAQMNPHFIFNCLNAIKYYSTENESAKAADYLTKFAKLIRLVLENSRSNRVTLHDELEALQLYLEMEAMRFGSKLTFTMTVEPAIDLAYVEIPPLLIQPYVENAIWHGLMHKEEGGTVWVQVEQPQNDQLRITIRDDGVGRAKATELKSKSATQRKSFGMKITSERIELINQLYQTKTHVQINDLTDAMGNALGTQVVLDIPI
jgi:sensor histidine kinase YesM